MDLTNLDSRAASETEVLCQLRHPTTGARLVDDDSGEAIGIWVIGIDSKEYQRTQHGQVTRHINQRTGKRGRLKITGEELEADAIETLTIVTKRFQHIVVDGTEWEATPGKAQELYERFPWIREQVDEFVDDRSNFLGE